MNNNNIQLDDDIYTVYSKDGIELENRHITQNGNDIDTEDRVQVGLELLDKYMNI